MPDAPEKVRWVNLAVKHGLAVQIVPSNDVPEYRKSWDLKKGKEIGSKAVVDEVLLCEAESAAAEHGGTPWLVTGKKRMVEDRDTHANRSSTLRNTTPSQKSQSGKKPPLADDWTFNKLPARFHVGKFKGRQIGIIPDEKGRCQWHAITIMPNGEEAWEHLPQGDSKSEAAMVQKGFLRALRSGLDWGTIERLCGIGRRHWEGLEQGDELRLHRALLIFNRLTKAA
jgi:hypothetical protein